MTAPERSLAQRRDALKRANEIRTKRARMKADIRAGRRSALTILGEPPAYVESMKVWDLLLAIPKVGRVKANKSLTQCRISPSKTIGGLSQRQRDELVSLLRRPVASPAQAAHEQREAQPRVVHAESLTRRPLCNTSAADPKMSSVEAEVTCLTCVGCLRADVRHRLRDERASRSVISV